MLAIKNLANWVAEMLNGNSWTKLEMRCAGSTIERNNADAVAVFLEEIRKVADDAFDAADDPGILVDETNARHSRKTVRG